MTPSVVHRYSFRLSEAIEALIGDAVGDCEAMQLRVDGDLVIIDIVAPTPAPAGRKVVETAPPIDGQAEPIPEPQEKQSEKRKGGAIAKKAGMICAERGFWTFVSQRFRTSVQSADDVANWLRAHCGVESRSDLDHDDHAAATFRDISKAYALWLEGYD